MYSDAGEDERVVVVVGGGGAAMIDRRRHGMRKIELAETESSMLDEPDGWALGG